MVSAPLIPSGLVVRNVFLKQGQMHNGRRGRDDQFLSKSRDVYVFGKNYTQDMNVF